LNDPYKRDRIDGCMLDIVRFCFSFLIIALPGRVEEPKPNMGCFGGIGGHLGLNPGFADFRGIGLV
jgi:hypothetical protein